MPSANAKPRPGSAAGPLQPPAAPQPAPAKAQSPDTYRAQGRFGRSRRRSGTIPLTRARLRLPSRSFLDVTWRGDRVAEGTRLLSGRRRNPTEGSNPSLSANRRKAPGLEKVPGVFL